MKAIILAAGVARRLAPLTGRTPKCLLPVGDRSLLTRMLTALDVVGVSESLLVVGHGAAQIRAAAGDKLGRMRIGYVENPAYTKGSALSLQAARARLAEPVLIMDADVLFPVELLRRLVTAPAPSAFLIDRGFEDTGEEVKVYTRGDRVIALGKKVTPESWELVGEGIGFFKCGAEAGPELARLLTRVVAESDGHAEYEDALNLLVASRHVGWVEATGLPWTEIDFAEDLRRAQDTVLPRIAQLDGA